MKLIPKLFFSAAASIGILACLQTTAYSNESVSIEIPPDSEQSCADAVGTVESELVEKGFFSPWEGEIAPGKAVQVTPEIRESANDIENSYHGYPAGRTHTVNFDLSGEVNKVYTLLTSPQLMSILSAQIMSDCPQVGLVRFNHWLEGGVPVGYFPDNTARSFIGVSWGRTPGFISEEDIEIRTVETQNGSRRLYPWGYYLFI